MAKSLYKPVPRVQENERVCLTHEFQALKGSGTITSGTKLSVAKQRRLTDVFKDAQSEPSDSQEESFSPIVEQEGSSTGEESEDSNIGEIHGQAAREFGLLEQMLS
jgi:hypothetical protein